MMDQFGRRLALGWLKHTAIDQSARFEQVLNMFDLACSNQFSLGCENILDNAERRQIILDVGQQPFHGDIPECIDPLFLGRADKPVPERIRQFLADRDHIVARIKPFRHLTDLFAQRFPVAEMRRTRQLIDLLAGIVDVIFRRDVKASLAQQIDQRIANHCTTGVRNVIVTEDMVQFRSLPDDKGQVVLQAETGVIARVLETADDHPDTEELYNRASAVDPRISMSTVYRTVALFEDAGIIERHDFREGKARYEPAPENHHDHLIDMKSGTVIEFHSEEIEALQEIIARRLGYRLVDHRLELYAVPLAPSDRIEKPSGNKDKDKL